MSKPEYDAALRSYRPPAPSPIGKKLRVELPVVRMRRESSPSLSIYSGQSADPAPETRSESLTRMVERSPFRAGLGLGLGFATGTALFRMIAVLFVYGIVFAVLLTLLRKIL